jgi:HEAT repeat protein
VDDRAVPLLAEALEDEVPAVRRAAAEALENIESKAVPTPSVPETQAAGP